VSLIAKTSTAMALADDIPRRGNTVTKADHRKLALDVNAPSAQRFTLPSFLSGIVNDDGGASGTSQI
jgi:hypothetical protein